MRERSSVGKEGSAQRTDLNYYLDFCLMIAMKKRVSNCMKDPVED